MRRLWLVSPKEATHEEAFLERYDRLLGQALHITERRYSAAEDLVHDAYIQFTLSKPDLSTINDLDSYLFIVLRNMHLSQVRRSSYNRFAPISIADYDSAAIGLRSFDIQNQVVVADELLRICDYVCARKETSKAASVLILRFFHGYFTSEIAALINSPRRTVHEWLRLARNEVKVYLDDPKVADSSESLPLKKVGNEHDLLAVLRDRIFSSRHGACLSAKQLNNLYVENGSPIECKTLAHIASCRHCLDQINNIRKLPPFSDRYPIDALGSDTRSSSGGNQMNRGTRTDVLDDHLKLCRRRLGEVLDHQPTALSFSANGFILGSQKVNADTTEQVLSINIDEEVSFVEVFSEQGIRLMFMDVLPSSIGGVEQGARLQLDEGREVECAISFRQPWPTLHVTYRVNELTSPGLLVVPNVNSDPVVSLTASPVKTSDASHLSFLSRLFGFGLWLRPEMIVAVVICCAALAAAYWYTRKTPHPVPLSANELLQKAVANEDLVAVERGSAIHRTINFEEASSNGAVIAKKRIEVWQNVDRGIVVRRLFNDRGELVAGDWRRADGVQTLYQHGVDPRIQLSPGKRDALPLAFDQIWQLSTSAREFATLATNENLRVEEGTNTVKLWYETRNGNVTGRSILKASLTLNRSDLHVLSQTLLVQQGDDVRTFRFIETSIEKHSPEKVPATVFEPDPSLVPSKRKESVESTTNESKVATPPTPNSPALATADLEIEVLRILNQVQADTGEQIFVRRTASGTIYVDGVVELTSRKQQILQALGPMIGNPALKVNLETVDERVARETRTRTSSDSTSLERIQVASNSIPLEPELRQYFASRGIPNNQIDDEVQKFSRTALTHSSQALQHAGALRSLTGRFSVEELKTLDSASRAKWLALVQQHALGLRTNVVLLQRELGEALGQKRTDVFAEPSIEDDAVLIQTVNRLFTTASAIDQSVRATLSLSNNPGSAAKIKGAQFWRSLAIAEDLASKVASSK